MAYYNTNREAGKTLQLSWNTANKQRFLKIDIAKTIH